MQTDEQLINHFNTYIITYPHPTPVEFVLGPTVTDAAAKQVVTQLIMNNLTTGRLDKIRNPSGRNTAMDVVTIRNIDELNVEHQARGTEWVAFIPYGVPNRQNIFTTARLRGITAFLER